MCLDTNLQITMTENVEVKRPWKSPSTIQATVIMLDLTVYCVADFACFCRI